VTSRLLSHAVAWEEDATTEQVRVRLQELERDPYRFAPPGWSVALAPRRRAEALRTWAISAVTLTDRCDLTARMIHSLPPLWLHGGRMRVALAPVPEAQEVADEPAIALLVRVLTYGDYVLARPRKSVLAARELPAHGLLFTTTLTGPPPGWPR
jgi:hypothetical protein